MDSEISEKKKIYFSVFYPSIICFLIILVFVFENAMDLNFKKAGIFPRDPKTLINIFSMPFIHADLSHLFNNVISFFFLSSTLYYFYSEIANKIMFLSVILSGLILWIIGRESWHIGLSGIIFALSFFLFFSGIIRRYAPLIAISLIVAFLYGNNIWHLFPWQKFDPISWEGHLAGAISGIILSFSYRKQGPQKPKEDWEEEDDNSENESDDNNLEWYKNDEFEENIN